MTQGIGTYETFLITLAKKHSLIDKARGRSPHHSAGTIEGHRRVPDREEAKKGENSMIRPYQKQKQQKKNRHNKKKQERKKNPNTKSRPTNHKMYNHRPKHTITPQNTTPTKNKPKKKKPRKSPPGNGETAVESLPPNTLSYGLHLAAG